VLAGKAQRRAAGREHEESRRGAEQIRDEGSRRQKLLEVVEHEQHALAAQVLGYRRGELAVTLLHTERLGDRRNEQLVARDRSKVDEERTVGKLRLERRGNGERQSRFARSARAGQGREAHVFLAEEPRDRRHFEVAPDQRGERDRERRLGAGLGLGRRQRRLLPQDRALELLEVRARLEAELLDENPARVAVSLERVSLSPGAVERQNPLLGSRNLPRTQDRVLGTRAPGSPGAGGSPRRAGPA